MTTSLPNNTLHPYNPWASYIVEASAGSGKTWQLSRRFLALVIAGADPSSILAVTFTKKAAAEMRERIVQDALRLVSHSHEFEDFFQQIKRWRPASTPGQLLSPSQASQVILQKTQTLKIMTIDALFIQWCRRHPLETSVEIGEAVLESPWNLLSSLESKKLYKEAWAQVLASAPTDEDNKSFMEALVANAPNAKLRSLLTAISPLVESETFNWYLNLISGDSSLKQFSVGDSFDEAPQFIEKNQDLLLTVISLASNEEKRHQGSKAVHERSIDGLVESAIVTSGYEGLNGTTFSKARKSGDPSFLQLADKLRQWSEQRRLANLNRTGELLWRLFEARTATAHKLKAAARLGGFADSAKGVSLLACNDEFAGARSLAWASIGHLLLDEFQDTSRLQWLIFERLAKELLSGGSTDPNLTPSPSVFIVGDKKQSIYRFREADPEVLSLARDNLNEFGLKSLSLSRSFRSSPVILHYVNEVFKDGLNIPEFPTHEAALQGLKGSICLYQLPVNKEDGQTKESSDTSEDQRMISNGAKAHQPNPTELEASVIAKHISACLSGEIPLKISNKDGTTWRKPRPSDFVILYAKSTHSQAYEDALRKLLIPASRSEKKGFYQRPEINDLARLLRWLAWPADSVSLCTILKSPICGLSDLDLQTLIAMGSSDIFDSLKNQFPNIYAMLKDLLDDRHKDSVAVLTGKLLSSYQIADRYLLNFGSVEGPLAKANILKWFDELRSVSGDGTGSLDSVLTWLDEKREEDETGNASLSGDAVTLMTIHKSKGLEFPCVILAGTSEDWHRDDHGWIKDTRPGNEGFWYIGTAAQRPKESKEISELISYNINQSRFEKARLLYVALTRASQHLVITGSPSTNPNAFWQLLFDSSQRLQNYTQEKFSLADGVERIIITSPQDASFKEDLEEIAKKQEGPTLSQEVPSKIPALKILNPSIALLEKHQDEDFKLSEILDHREISPEQRKCFGILVHKLIELHLTEQLWSEERLKSLIFHEMKGQIDNSASLNLLKIAKLDVSKFLESATWEDLSKHAKRIFCELPMAAIQDDQLINAISDLVIERQDGSYTVVDFKTSLVDQPSAKTLCQTRGYADQVRLYCEILRKAKKGAIVKGHVVFVNPTHLVDIQ